MTTTTKGIIYKTQDYKESSKLLFVYSPFGKVTLVGHGVKSYKHEYRVLSQYLTEIEFSYQEKEMFALSKAKFIDGFDDLKKNYIQLSKQAVILEIIDHLITDDIDHDKVYPLLIESLKHPYGYMIFALKLLFGFGYRLNFVGDDPTGFSIKNASVTTKKDGEYADIDLETTTEIAALYFYKTGDNVTLEPNQIKHIEHFIKTFYRYHMEYDIKGFKE
jgi:DNA repair protein RecO (recombination protein O)